jgi:hypothetical protein
MWDRLEENMEEEKKVAHATREKTTTFLSSMP